MYQAQIFVGASSNLSSEDSSSTASRGGGPLGRGASQPYPRGGFYPGPPGGLPGGGGGLLGSGNIGVNVNPALQAGAPLSMNGSLKGMALAIFNGNRKNTKQFMQEFTLYHMINQETSTM
jgi:hypothetical protein